MQRQQNEASRFSDETLNTTAKILSVTNQTKTMASDTLQELKKQGRQLGNIQGDMDDIRQEQAIGKRHLNTLSNFFSSLFNLFHPHIKSQNHHGEANKKLAENAPKPTPYQQKPYTHVDDTSFLQLTPQNAEKWQKTNAVLDDVQDDVVDLEKIAVKIGQEVKAHNQRLDVLNQDAEDAKNAVSDMIVETKLLRN